MRHNNRYNKSIDKKTHINYKNEIKEDIAPNIVTHYSWNGEGHYGRGISLSYSFNIPVRNDMLDGLSPHDFFPFNQFQVNQAKKSMQAWADIANISFTEAVDFDNVNIGFYNFSEKSIRSGFAFHPNYSRFSGVYINHSFGENTKPTKSNYGGFTLTHEIGHSLGLKHPHNAGDTIKDQKHTHQVSIMSYYSESSSNADYCDDNVSTPQLYDVAAVQYLYGANMKTRTGDTIYGFNSNSERDFFTANAPTDNLIFCVWDAGGMDTFDFSGYSEDQNINLKELSFSDVGGLTANISIAADVVIENAIGGSGNDTLYGNDANNILSGGAGADQLWGINGHNVFRYDKPSDSTSISADTIHDFNAEKDKIDLSPFLSGNRNIPLIVQNYDDISEITSLMIDFGISNRQYECNMMIKLIGKHQFTLNNFIISPPLTGL
ncbi:M10 family metallopeptidase C-terminal domain-containing protein [Yersinia mollaretii]|uniref:M10 family metallopeptidase C-terminal domain-containing protein n=1 Tax=Yersinia mollaretii TaxID=33060 RepID=UPI0005DE6F19|nr:M10 family metallopeptidase C-terminal domain-containing protein [Yersinia mollaretii]MDN0110380.1 M10 family metallopeptidase C-terminal domain-containing protein [Yersinia mollaretii]PJE87891.1 peptidase M10 [Yersinia mollaretii]CQD42426.1 metalloprotease [Yersinia mollaretii]CQH22202.1 metalloprotease [Yersinia mollaretii]